MSEFHKWRNLKNRKAIFRALPYVALAAVLAGSGVGSDMDSIFQRLSSTVTDSDNPAASPVSATLKTGDVVTNSIGMKLSVIPPGEFQMGSPPTEEKRSGDEEQHTIRLTKPYLMGAYEVTQEQFQKLMGTNPSAGESDSNLPVVNVSWEQAVAFCQKLSATPEERTAGRVYRLPTEAEWEFACRAATTSVTHFGNSLTSMQANFDGNYPYGSDDSGLFLGKPQLVGSYQPNAFGLYDMHGNVWEWCSDWYAADYYMSSPTDDPTGPATGLSHVIRGGSWYNFGYACRSAYRSEFTPPLDANIYGFRVVASLGSGSFEAGPIPVSTPLPTMRESKETMAITMPAMMEPERSMMSPETMSSPSPSASTVMTPPRVNEDGGQLAPSDAQFPAIVSQASPTGLVVLNRFVFATLSLLYLAALVNVSQVRSWRNLDLTFLVALVVTAFVYSFAESFALSSLYVLSIAIIVRLGWGHRRRRLPEPVSATLKSRWLFAILAMAFVFRLVFTVGTSFVVGNNAELSLAVLSGVLQLSTAAAIFVLGRGRFDSRFGLSLAGAFLLLPFVTNSESLPMSASVTATLWAFVLMSRPLWAGTLLGIAIMSWLPALFLVPIWSRYYLGRAKTKFVVSSILVLMGGLIVLETSLALGLSQLLPIPSLFARWLPEGMFWAALLPPVVACAVCIFRIQRATEQSLTILTATTLVLAQFAYPAAMSAFAVAPWIWITMLGYASPQTRVTWSSGIYPLLRSFASNSIREMFGASSPVPAAKQSSQ